MQRKFRVSLNSEWQRRWYFQLKGSCHHIYIGRIFRNNTGLDRFCAGVEVELEGHCQLQLHIFLQTIWTMVGSYILLVCSCACNVCFGREVIGTGPRICRYYTFLWLHIMWISTCTHFSTRIDHSWILYIQD